MALNSLSSIIRNITATDAFGKIDINFNRDRSAIIYVSIYLHRIVLII